MEDVFHLGIKALIRNPEGQILLFKADTTRNHAGYDGEDYWDIPGGRVQRGESVEQTLRREIEEETGVSDFTHVEHFETVISNHRIKAGDFGLILRVYVVSLPANAQIVMSEEHTEFGWFAPQEAAKLLTHKYPEEFTSQVSRLDGATGR